MRLLNLLCREIKRNSIFFSLFIGIGMIFLTVSFVLFPFSMLISQKSVSLFCDFNECFLTFRDVKDLSSFRNDNCFFLAEDVLIEIKGYSIDNNYQMIYFNEKTLNDYIISQGRAWNECDNGEKVIWVNEELFKGFDCVIGQNISVKFDDSIEDYMIAGTVKEGPLAIMSIDTSKRIIDANYTMKIKIENQNASILYPKLLKISNSCANDYGYFEGMEFMNVCKTLVFVLSVVIFIFSFLIINRFIGLLFLKRGKIYSVYEALGFTQIDTIMLTIFIGIAMSLIEFGLSIIFSVALLPLFEEKIYALFGVRESINLSYQFIVILFLIQLSILCLKTVIIGIKRGKNSITSYLKEVM